MCMKDYRPFFHKRYGLFFFLPQFCPKRLATGFFGIHCICGRFISGSAKLSFCLATVERN